MEASYFADYLVWLGEHLLLVDFYFLLLILVAFVVTALINFLGLVTSDFL